MHLICEWGTDSGFLLHYILPDAARMQLKRELTLEQILHQIPESTKTIWWHINLTRPHNLISEFSHLNSMLESRGIKVVNGRIMDIGKAFLMSSIKKAGGRVPAPSYGDWVIVKTEDNHAGIMDRKLQLESGSRKCPARDDIILFNPRRYPVLRYESVPPQWQCNPELIIQKYISNSSSLFLRAYFLGNALVTSVARSMADVKRMSSCTERRQQKRYVSEYSRRDTDSDIVRQVRIAKNAMNIDYGTADLVIDDFSRCWIIDVNTTPFWGEDQPNEIMSVLRLDDFLLF
jgi:hypothetical protein